MLVVGKEGKGAGFGSPPFFMLDSPGYLKLPGPGCKTQDVPGRKTQDVPDRKLDISHRKGIIKP